jgi:protein involved in polysaccharide export with SLBB domain
MPAPRSSSSPKLLLSLYFVAVVFLTGCSLSAPAIESNYSSNETGSAESATPEASQSSRASARAADLQKLMSLWQERTRQGVSLDYPIGAGDIVEVSVPAIQDIGSRLVRVSGEGTISLPFIGVVKAEGLQEEELAEAIRTKLEKYMYTPRVSLFVK